MLADSGIIDFNLTGLLALLIFLVTIAVLWRVALGPVSRLLDQRERRIEAGLEAAAEAERRLAEVQTEVNKTMEEARAQAREILNRSHQEATLDADALRNRARREAEAIVDKARADIDVERERAVQEIRTQLSGLVVEAAQKVIGQTIDQTTHRRLIEESLGEVSQRA